MPNYCSEWQIDVNDSDSFTATPGGNQLRLLSIDDEMLEEIVAPMTVQNQVSRPIGATSAVPRGRENAEMRITFSKVKRDHANEEDARRFQFDHPIAVRDLQSTNRTLFAEIKFRSDAGSDDPSATNYKTSRCHIESVDVRLIGGTDTATTYVMLWKVEP